MLSGHPLGQNVKDNNWHPILSGSLAEDALTTIAEIVAALPAPGYEALDASLSGGVAGLAILCGYLAKSDYDDGENAEQFLEQAVQTLTEEPLGPSFYVGFTGVAWAIAHLREQLFEADDEDPNEEVDQALQEYLSRWKGDYDLVNGLVGIGVYALKRLPRPAARDILESVVTLLSETAEYGPEGVTWFTESARITPRQRESYPEGYYNLGVAHGVPGVIAFLGEVCAAGIALDRAAPLLEGAVAWLLHRKLPDSAKGLFSSWVAPGVQQNEFRIAWCYGGAGVAAALLHAGRCVERPDWEREALDIARRVALRAREKSDMADTGLCHGTAGLGHIFNRIFQATGDEFFKEAARFWFQRTLELKRPGQGIGGYTALFLDEQGESIEEPWPGLLVGATGIALALLAAVNTVSPAWDQMLLLSIPSGHSS
jgi:lantibiotic biosynthesis protein